MKKTKNKRNQKNIQENIIAQTMENNIMKITKKGYTSDHKTFTKTFQS